MRNDLAILQTILHTFSQNHLTDFTLAGTVEKMADLTGWQGVSLLKPSVLLGELTVLTSAGPLALLTGATVPATALTPAREDTSGAIHYVSNAAHFGAILPGLQAVGSMIIVPLVSQGHSCVTMLCTSDRVDGFDDQDLALAEALRDTFILAYRSTNTGVENTGYLQAWMSSSSDGVILLDNELQVTMLNYPALNYLNLPGSIEEWQQRPIWDLARQVRRVNPDFADQIYTDLQHVIVGRNDPTEGEYKLDLHTIHWYSLPVHDQLHHLGRILVLRNVAENRRLRELRQDLTETVVSDIQAPLGHLTTTLSSMAPENGNQRLVEEDRHVVENALSTAQTMLTMINEFVDMSQLESGQMPLSPSAFSFPDLVDNVARLEQPLVQERHLNLEKHVDESLPLTWGDRPLIQRVLRNIITNALKTMPSGGSLQVEANVEPRNGDKIRVSISDTIRRTTRPARSRKAIQPSGSPENISNREPWMAFCHVVLEAHGERLWISRFDDREITVTFTLPQVLGSLTHLETFH